MAIMFAFASWLHTSNARGIGLLNCIIIEAIYEANDCGVMFSLEVILSSYLIVKPNKYRNNVVIV